MSAVSPLRMSSAELRHGAILALVFGLRMLGLFLVLPVFSVYAKTLPGGESLAWAGLAMGAFALTQAVLHIPFGAVSDRLGRKPMILFGLGLYALGSLMVAWAPDIYWMIAARCLQGSGAISAVVMALAADLTRDVHRAKVMALIGASIGGVFALSLVAAPALYGWIGMGGMFELIAALAVVAMAMVVWAVPTPERHPAPHTARWREVLTHGSLLRLDLGVFVKHMLQMALFLTIPRLLVEQHGFALPAHWKLYLPVVLASFVVAAPAIVLAERHGKLKQVFLWSIAGMLAALLGMLGAAQHFAALVVMLLLFFVCFNILEASMPALVSRIAPAHAKGLALGAYSTAQSLGAGVGPIAGGYLALEFGFSTVCVVGAVLCALWWWLTLDLRMPALLIQLEYELAPGIDVDAARQELAATPGVAEVFLEPESRMARLKVNLERWDENKLQHLFN